MKKKYVPDLKAQMATCEANYVRLGKLMPDLDKVSGRHFCVLWRQHAIQVSIRVEERFNYTTSLRIEQRGEGLSWLQMPDLIVRLYHDARMAEVICRKRRPMQGRYSYPNAQMHHPDEKQQLNHYLGEWLAHCLAHGHSNEPLAIA